MRGLSQVALSYILVAFLVAGCKLPLASQSEEPTTPQNSESDTAVSSVPYLTIESVDSKIVPNGCHEFKVTHRASTGSASGVSERTTVYLSTGAGAKVYRESTCATRINYLQFVSGNSQKSFYVKDTAEEDFAIVADSSNATILAGSTAVAMDPFTDASSSTSSVSFSADNIVANNSNSATIQVTLKDKWNNLVSGVTPVFSASGSNNTVGACSASSASGVSTCSLKSKTAEAKVLSLTSPVAVTGSTITFVAGAADHLLFAAEPSGSNAAGTAFGTTPKVKIVDLYDNLVSSATNNITLSISGGGSLGGTLTVAASSGVATFTSAYPETVATSKKLRADATLSGAVNVVMSGSFDVTAGPAYALDLTVDTSTPTAGSCLVLTASVLDQYGNATTAGVGGISVSLSNLGTGSTFYSSASNCSAGTSALSGSQTITSGQSSKNWYVKNTAVESKTITSTAGSLGSTTDTVAVTWSAGSAYQLDLSVDSATPTAGGCIALTASVLDAFGNATTAGAGGISVTLSNLGTNGSFYATSGNCSSGSSALSGAQTISSGQSSKTWYVKNTTAENKSITSTAGSLGSTTDTVAVTWSSAAAYQLDLTVDNATPTAASCIALTASVLDQYGNATTASAGGISVSLSNLGTGGSFYATSGNCTLESSALSGAQTISSGQSSKTWYVKNTTAEATTVTSTAGSLGSTADTVAVTWSAGSAYQLDLTVDSASPTAGSCIALTASVYDQHGNASAAGAGGISVTLSNLGTTGTFYATSGNCSAGASALSGAQTISSAQASKTWYVKNTTAEASTITSTAASLTSTTDTVAVTWSPASANSLDLVVDSATPTAGSCIMLTASVQDQYFNSATAGAGGISVTLSNLGTGGTFYATSGNCSAGSSALSGAQTIASGQSSKTWYVKNTTAESKSITSTAASLGSTTDTVAVTWSAASAYALDLSVDSASPSTGSCIALTATIFDLYGNTAIAGAGGISVALSNLGTTGSFYATSANCTTESSPLSGAQTIASGLSSKTWYVKNGTAESKSLTTTAASLGSPVSAISVSWSSSGEYQLDLSVDSATPTVGDCIQLTASVLDQFGNSTTAGASGISVTFSNLGTGGSLYLTSGNCSAGTNVQGATQTITSGLSSKSWYVKNTAVESKSITSTASSLTSTTDSVSVAWSAGTEYQLDLTVDNPSPTVGGCIALTASVLDQYGNPTTAGASGISVTLSNLGTTSSFYASSGNCSAGSGALSGAQTISSGASSKTWYVKNSTAETLSVVSTANSLSFPGDTVSVTWGASTAAAIDLSLASLSPTVGACIAATVAVKDSSGNPTASPMGGINVALTNLGSTSSFYATSGDCTSGSNALSGAQNIAQGALNAIYYVKNTTAESKSLTATASSLSSSDSETVVWGAGVGAKLDITVDNASPSVGTCIVATVSVQDTYGNASTASSAVTLALSQTGTTGSYYSTSANCSSDTNAISISSGMLTGASSKTFYVKNNTPETVNLKVSSTLGADDTVSVTWSAAGPYQLDLTVDSSSKQVGGCIELTATVKDQLNNTTAATSNISVTFSGYGLTGALYANGASCTSETGAQSATQTITTGNSYIQLYVKNKTKEVTTILSTAASLTDTTDDVEVTWAAQPAAQMNLTASSSTPTVGTCVALTVTFQDIYENTVSLSGSLDVDFSGLGTTGKIYENSTDCANETNHLTAAYTVAGGEDDKVFYVKNKTAETSTILATTASLSDHQDDINLTWQAGAADHVTLAVGSNTPTVGTCTAFTLQVKDENGNATNAPALLNVTLSGAGSMRVYANSTQCGDDVNRLSGPFSVTQGSPTRTYYVNHSVAEPLTIGLSTNLAGTSVGDTMTWGAASGYTVDLTVDSASQKAGLCVIVTATLKDNSGNTATASAGGFGFAFSDLGSSQFYADPSSCLGRTSPLSGNQSVASGSQTAVFYFTDTVAEALTLKATTISTAQTDTVGVTFTPANAASAKISLADSTPTVGDCVEMTVTLYDQFSNVNGIAPHGDANVSFTAYSSMKFYDSLSDCQTPASSDLPSPGFAIERPNTARTIYVRNELKETIPLVMAVDHSITGETYNIPWEAAALAKLAITGSATPTAGTCETYTVTAQDTYGNTVVLAANEELEVGTLEGGSVLGTTSCPAVGAGSLSVDLTISSGQSSTTFKMNEKTAQVVNLLADPDSAAVSNGTLSVTVAAAGADHLSASAALIATVDDCVPISLYVEDVYGNVTTTHDPLSAVMSGVGNGVLFTDACSTPLVGNLTIDDETTHKNFYMTNTKAETTAVLGQDTILPEVELNESVSIEWKAGTPHMMLAGDITIVNEACDLYTVTLEDDHGNAVTNATAFDVDLGKEYTGYFYAGNDSTCTTSLVTPKVNFAAGATSVTFRFKSTSPNYNETLAVSESDASVSIDGAQLAVAVAAADFTAVLLTHSFTNAVAADCNEMTVNLQAGGSAFIPSSPVTVTLSAVDSNGDDDVTTFYASSGCASTVSSVSVPITQSSATFYFRHPKADATLNITATTTASRNHTKTVTVVENRNPGEATALSISASPGPTPNPQAGYCQWVSVSARDIDEAFAAGVSGESITISIEGREGDTVDAEIYSGGCGSSFIVPGGVFTFSGSSSIYFQFTVKSSARYKLVARHNSNLWARDAMDATAAGGFTDSSFNYTGYYSHYYSSSDSRQRMMVMPSDGTDSESARKYVFVGKTYLSGKDKFATEVYDETGTSLDTTFHPTASGSPTPSPKPDDLDNANFSWEATALTYTRESSPKILIAGQGTYAGNRRVGLVGYELNGSDAFSPQEIDLGLGNYPATIHSVVSADDGSIFLIGKVTYVAGTDDDALIIKRQSTGSADGTFNSSGKWTGTYGGNERFYAGVYDSVNDKLFVTGEMYNNTAGTTRQEMHVARFDLTGTSPHHPLPIYEPAACHHGVGKALAVQTVTESGSPRQKLWVLADCLNASDQSIGIYLVRYNADTEAIDAVQGVSGLLLLGTDLLFDATTGAISGTDLVVMGSKILVGATGTHQSYSHTVLVRIDPAADNTLSSYPADDLFGQIFYATIISTMYSSKYPLFHVNTMGGNSTTIGLGLDETGYIMYGNTTSYSSQYQVLGRVIP